MSLYADLPQPKNAPARAATLHHPPTALLAKRAAPPRALRPPRPAPAPAPAPAAPATPAERARFAPRATNSLPALASDYDPRRPNCYEGVAKRARSPPRPAPRSAAVAAMMRKMGWEGGGLGARGQGVVEPVVGAGNRGRVGLGGRAESAGGAERERERGERVRGDGAERAPKRRARTTLLVRGGGMADVRRLCGGYGGVRAFVVRGAAGGEEALVEFESASSCANALLGLDGAAVAGGVLRCSWYTA